MGDAWDLLRLTLEYSYLETLKRFDEALARFTAPVGGGC